MVKEKTFTSTKEMAEVLPEGVELPEKTMLVIQHVLTTDRVDRDNDILRTAGAKLDPKAPLLWQHMHSMPIGGVLSEVSHDDRELKVVSALLDMNEITKDAGILVEANLLRFSHGFRVLDFEERQPEEDDKGWPGFDIKEFEIMEASLVSVPSNIDAEIEIVAGKKFESDFFKHYQKELVDSRPTVVAPQLKLKFGADGEWEVMSNSKDVEVELPAKTTNKEALTLNEVWDNCVPATKVEEKAEAESETAEEEKSEPTEHDAIEYLLRCTDEQMLRRIRDLAAGRIETLERAKIAQQVESLVGV
jgi:HK97 family phage prohead protease